MSSHCKPPRALRGVRPRACDEQRAGVKRQRGDGADRGRRKDNDPLQSFDAAGLDASAKPDSDVPKVFDSNDPELDKNQSSSGRVAWKKAHNKGDFKKGGPRRLKKFSKGAGDAAFRQKKF